MIFRCIKPHTEWRDGNDLTEKAEIEGWMARGIAYEAYLAGLEHGRREAREKMEDLRMEATLNERD